MSSKKQKISFNMNAESKALLTTLAKQLNKPVSVLIEEWVNEVLKSFSQQVESEEQK
jgi:predicted DNA-binding protein